MNNTNRGNHTVTEVISVKFRGRGKAYFFAPNGIKARTGDALVVETAKGMELGDCVYGNHMVEDTAPYSRCARSSASPRKMICALRRSTASASMRHSASAGSSLKSTSSK